MDAAGSSRNTSTATRTPRVRTDFGEGFLVHELRPRCIHKQRTGLEAAKNGRPDEVARLRRKREMEAERVAAFGNFFRRREYVTSTSRGTVRSAAAPSRRNRGLQTTTSKPKARARACNFLSNTAKTKQAQRAAVQSARLGKLSLFHRPARRSATLSGMRRSSARRRPKASSATATAFFPGQFDTYIPRFAAAAHINGVYAGSGTDHE